MTIEVFCEKVTKLANKLMLEINQDEMRHFCNINSMLMPEARPNIPQKVITNETKGAGDQRYMSIEFSDPKRSFPNQLIIMSSVLKTDSMFYSEIFETLEKAFDYLNMTNNDKLGILLFILNRGIDKVDKEYLTMYTKQMLAITHPDLNLITVNDIINKEVQQKLACISNLRKYINEDGSLNAISAEHSNVKDFQDAFSISPKLAQLVINSCDKLFIKANKTHPQKKVNVPQKNPKPLVDIISKTKSNQETYKKLSQYVELHNQSYKIILTSYVNDDLKLKIMMLAQALGITSEKQEKLLLNIIKHNNQIFQNELKDKIKTTMSTYFTEETMRYYQIASGLINKEDIAQNYNYQYYVKRIIEIKNEIDEFLFQFANGQISPEELQTYLAVDFESLKEMLNQAFEFGGMKEASLLVRTEKNSNN